MSNPDLLVFKIVETIVIGVVLLVAIIASGIVMNNYVAMKQGYECVVVPGLAGSVWQKVK